MCAAGDHDIRAEHVPPEISEATSGDAGGGSTLQHRKADAERQIIMEALDRNDWQITRTAQELGLADHSSLLKVMRRLGIRRP
jgi:transcriptional regulator with GAF, ATPase, and Fis domain